MNTWRERFGGAALVTGASSGIGEAFARALAARKMDLVLVARRQERLEALAAELEKAHGVRARAVPADAGDIDVPDWLEDELREQGVEVGLVVNNAGIGWHGDFAAQESERIAATVDLNCRAPAQFARAFVPAMLSRGRGGLLFVGSTAGHQPVPYWSVYGATKAFDRSLGLALWAELAPKGIEVLTLSPGYTLTEFQEKSNGAMDPPGGTARPEEVVEAALAALGRTPLLVPGARNRMLALLAELLPTAFVAKAAAKRFSKAGDAAVPRPPRSSEPESPSDFTRTIARMLITFFSVSAIDVVVGSLLTHKLRFWFPNWLDAQWETRPGAWVVYSQSYLSGVFFIPLLAASVTREFFPSSSRAARAGIGLGTVALLCFLGWWKGGLMVAHHKELEAVGWLALTAILWTLLRLGEALPRMVGALTPRRLAAGLTTGVAVFFLVMALLDPLMQIGLQRLPWSQGLFVEVGFFIPAGLLLVAVARRLRAT